MLFRVMDKAELPALVAGFASEYEVVGPVARGSSFIFDEVGSCPQKLVIDYPTTILPPKKYLFPPKQPLFTFDTAANTVEDVPVEATPRVLFGLHACDINAINRLDAVFLDSEYVDPYYKAAREATIIVGVSCMPSENCFCGAWGTDEVSSGYDLFLHDIGDRYLVSILSVHAAEVLARYTSARPATTVDSVALQERTERFKAALPKTPSTSELPMLMDAFYDDPLWEELGSRCLSCAACSMVCPTCYCFDIRDVLSPSGVSGQRVRSWDSCTSPDFAVVAHGHNFRPTAASRVRNRFYHKFLGYLSKYDHVLCTGCGRCSVACKADINPRVVIEGLQKENVERRLAQTDEEANE